MVYTPEEEEKWAEGEIKVIDGKRYKVSYEVLPTGDVQMLLEEIEKIIGHDKMAELLDVPKELYASVIDESAHDCFLIEKRELLGMSEEGEEREFYERLNGFVTEILDFIEEKGDYSPKEHSGVVHLIVTLLRSHCPTMDDCLDTLEVVRKQVQHYRGNNFKLV